MKGAIIYDVMYLRILQERIAGLIIETEGSLGIREAYHITSLLLLAHNEVTNELLRQWAGE